MNLAVRTAVAWSSWLFYWVAWLSWTGHTLFFLGHCVKVVSFRKCGQLKFDRLPPLVLASFAELSVWPEILEVVELTLRM